MNLMPALIEAARHHVSVGESMQALEIGLRASTPSVTSPEPPEALLRRDGSAARAGRRCWGG